MKFRKTPADKRSSYTFRFNDGSTFTVQPGEDGVTEADIRMLHSFDDAEVYNNLKNSRPELTKEEKAAKRAWESAHPGEKYQRNWNLSYDYFQKENDENMPPTKATLPWNQVRQWNRKKKARGRC